MRVTLSNISAQRLMIALRNVDSNENVTLAGLTRLDIARNINRLMPEVGAFERAAGELQRRIMPGADKIEANNAIMAELEKITHLEQSYRLRPLTHDALKLDDNQRITGDTIAALAPILKDFDSMAGEDGE